MQKETICKIELTDSNELLLVLESVGDSDYQFVYREAAGVYWDPEQNGFKSTPIRESSYSEWYSQIVTIVRYGVGVDLQLATNVEWVNVPLDDRRQIESAAKSW